MNQEERQRPYTGYVIGPTPVPKDPETVLWKVKIQTPGEFFGRRATIEHGSIPRGIIVGMDVRFNLATVGRNATLVATDVARYIRSGTPGRKKGECNE